MSKVYVKFEREYPIVDRWHCNSVYRGISERYSLNYLYHDAHIIYNYVSNHETTYPVFSVKRIAQFD